MSRQSKLALLPRVFFKFFKIKVKPLSSSNNLLWTDSSTSNSPQLKKFNSLISPRLTISDDKLLRPDWTPKNKQFSPDDSFNSDSNGEKNNSEDKLKEKAKIVNNKKYVVPPQVLKMPHTITTEKMRFAKWSNMYNNINLLLEKKITIEEEVQKLQNKRIEQMDTKTEIKKIRIAHPRYMNPHPKLKISQRRIKLIK